MFAFVSDVHLDEPHKDRYGAFLRFLTDCRNTNSIQTIFLMGDIFDVWVGDKKIFQTKYADIIEKIEILARTKQVIFIEGNHDFNLGGFWKKLGVEVHKDFHSFERKGKWLLTHGDLVDQEDKLYLSFRAFLRSFFIKFLTFILPGSIVHWLGTKMSSTHKKETSKKRHHRELRNEWKKLMLKFSSKKDFDYFICGHFHYKEAVHFDNKRTYNLGSWLDQPYEYLFYDGQDFKFVNVEIGV